MGDIGIPPDKRVVTTVALTLASLIDNFKTVITDLNVVYDEQGTYESTIAKIRSDNKQKNKLTADFYPCFSFNRSAMQYCKNAPGHRALAIGPAMLPIQGNNKSQLQFSFVQGDFDLNFMFITKSVLKLEEFEIKYLSENGLSQFKQFTVDLTPDLGGPQNYFATFNPLENKTFEHENNYYKMLTGSIKIRGMYYVFEGSSPVILSIQKRILDFLTKVLYEQETIT
jgi:hypothetical protein